MTEEEGTTFLNVDLEVISRTPHDPLVRALGRKVDVLHIGPWGRRYGAHVEVAGSGYRGNADSLVRRLVTLVKTLPRNARRLWDTAQSRESGWVADQATAECSTCMRLLFSVDEVMIAAGGRGQQQTLRAVNDGTS